MNPQKLNSYEFRDAPAGLGNVVGPGSSPSPARSLSSWILLISWTAATPPCCPLWWRTPPSGTTLWWTPTGVQLLKQFFISNLSVYIWSILKGFSSFLFGRDVPGLDHDMDPKGQLWCRFFAPTDVNYKTSIKLGFVQCRIHIQPPGGDLHVYLHVPFIFREHHHCWSEHHPGRPHSGWPRWLWLQTASPGTHQVFLSRLRAKHEGVHVLHLLVPLLHNSAQSIGPWRLRNFNHLLKSAET